MIYLASPYSHALESVREERFQAVCRKASNLMNNGLMVFSPIAHSHPIAKAGGLPGDFDFWEEFDRKMMSACSGVVVLRLPDWESSKGVAAEIKLAKEMNLPVRFIDP